MTDPRITRLAAQAAPQTKVAAKSALKAAGLKQTLADTLLSETDRLTKLRAAKAAARRALPQPIARPVRLPSGTPAKRLNALRQAAVLATLDKMIDRHTHGTWFCQLTTDPAAVGIRSNQYYTGENAGKWSIQATDTYITVPAEWRVRVQRRGLAIVDGMMTLDAAPLEAHGCELFAATFARRTGAKGVKVERGYIARADAITYHAATADQAISGIAKKRRELALTARLNAADLGALVARCPSARVSVGDARATGACVYGIRSWCAAVGLPVVYEDATDTLTGSATLSEVYTAYQREPRPEARATLIRALRRNRAVIEA